MSSDHQQQLVEMERALVDDDPKFVRKFRCLSPRRILVVRTVLGALAVMVGVMGLLVLLGVWQMASAGAVALGGVQVGRALAEAERPSLPIKLRMWCAARGVWRRWRADDEDVPPLPPSGGSRRQDVSS